MTKINSFEDLKVWQAARELSNDIYSQTKTEQFGKDYSLKDQINRAVGSIMDNIAEGYERNGNKELIQYLAIAKGSCGEVRSQLYRAFDRKHINQSDFELLKNKTIEINKQISGFISYLKKTEMKGSKYVVHEPESYYGSIFES